MSEINKGRIKTRVEIWCGICSWWEVLEWTKGIYCKKEAKEKGWKNTKKFGWICPKCADKIK